MCYFANLLMVTLASSLLLSTASVDGEDESITAFPTGFLMRYLENRFIRRAIIFTNLGNGVFKFGYIDMRKLIRDASFRFIHLNVLPFEESRNSTSSDNHPPFYSTLTAIPVPLIILVYDNSTEADNHLMQASSANLFRAKYKWLILTNDAIYNYLKALLLDLDANVDSDVTIGVASNDGNIELQDVYILGNRLYKTLIGKWQNNNVTCMDSENMDVCQNVSVNNSGSLTFIDHPPKSFLRSNFNGFRLRVVTVNVNSFYTVVTMNPENKLLSISGGYFGELLNILREALNFTYSVNLLDGYAYGVILSSSMGIPIWSGIVGELQNKKADITGCEVSLLPERQLVMDYSMPVQIISRRLYIHRPMRSGVGAGGSKSEATWYRGGGFVRPFELQVWFCVTASLLLFLAASRLHAFYTFPRKRHERSGEVAQLVVSKKEEKITSTVTEESNEPTGPPTLSSDFFRFTATLVQQGLPDDPDPDESKGEVDSTQSRRLILWTASATYLIIYTSYGAKLAAILASESEPQPPFTDLEGLLHTPDWKLGFIDKALGRVSFESAKPDSVMGRLWSERIKKDLDVLVPDIVTGLRKALEGSYAFLGFHTGVQSELVQSLSKKESEESTFTTSEVCRLLALPNDYLTGGIAFGFQEESPIKPIFDTWILAIRSCGLLDRMAKKWLPEALPCLEDQTVATVGLIDIAPALSALGFGVGISIIVLILELLYDFHSARES